MIISSILTVVALAPSPDSSAPTPAARDPWIKRLRPTRGMLELGVSMGVWRPPLTHNLIDPEIFAQRGETFPKLSPSSLDAGLHLDYLALSYLALGLRGSYSATHTAEGSSARLYRSAATVTLQLPLAAISPFVIGGLGLAGASGAALGQDVDFAYTVGGGVKLYAHRWVMLEFAALDTIAVDQGFYYGHHVQLNVSVAVTLLRARR